MTFEEWFKITIKSDFDTVKDLMVRKWELIQAEIDKCILLCSNCHREEHHNERNKEEPVLG